MSAECANRGADLRLPSVIPEISNRESMRADLMDAGSLPGMTANLSRLTETRAANQAWRSGINPEPTVCHSRNL
jgi:hypothetical protein